MRIWRQTLDNLDLKFAWHEPWFFWPQSYPDSFGQTSAVPLMTSMRCTQKGTGTMTTSTNHPGIYKDKEDNAWQQDNWHWHQPQNDKHWPRRHWLLKVRHQPKQPVNKMGHLRPPPRQPPWPGLGCLEHTRPNQQNPQHHPHKQWLAHPTYSRTKGRGG